MPFQLYVGNVPSHFSAKDVLNLFSEYEGIEVDKFFKKNHKCFSFLSCVDIEQLVSVVKEMNNFVVCDRNLVVRASDRELQKYVDILIEEENDIGYLNTSHENVHKINKKESLERTRFARKSHTDISSSYSNDELSCSNMSDESLDSSLPIPMPKNRKILLDRHLSTDSKNSVSSTCDTSDVNEWNIGSPCIENQKADDVDTILSANSDDLENCTWVSVTNFPLGTSTKAIMNLFSDYDPIDIVMICNEPRKDRTLTEALVCFQCKEIADDVILNFDNTIFERRLLLVNDIEDLTIMRELLDVNKFQRS